MRRGVSILEVLIAMAISTALTLVLFNVLTGGTRVSEKTMNTLGYLRDASLLMENIKKDIRSASRSSAPSSISGGSPTIITNLPDGREVDIKYEYDTTAKIVTRRGGDGRTSTFGHGRAGAVGHITEFEVTPVDGPGGEVFFQVVVAFASPDQEARETAGKAARPRHHRVQALVNRRTPSDTDDKWNAAFR